MKGVMDGELDSDFEERQPRIRGAEAPKENENPPKKAKVRGKGQIWVREMTLASETEFQAWIKERGKCTIQWMLPTHLICRLMSVNYFFLACFFYSCMIHIFVLLLCITWYSIFLYRGKWACFGQQDQDGPGKSNFSKTLRRISTNCRVLMHAY